jgi:dTDP-4-dehydrorhamnose reductase
MRVLVLGASGMLGSTAFRGLWNAHGIAAFATARGDCIRQHFAPSMQANLITGVDVLDTDTLLGVLARVRPDAVLNCVGVVKQLDAANDPLIAVPLNTVFPHRLARAAALIEARVVHISTDCVFRGAIGNYTESMLPDAMD